MDGLSLGRIGRRFRAFGSDPSQAKDRIDDFDAASQQTVPANPALAADRVGVLPFAGELGVAHSGLAAAWLERRMIRDRIENSDVPYLVVDPRPGLHIIDCNRIYAEITLTPRRKMRGRKLFDVFPDNPDDPAASGVHNLYLSLCRAAETRKTHGMATQRYDVADARGEFVERHWSPANTPIYDDDGRLLYLLHHVRDVTAEVLKARANRSAV